MVITATKKELLNIYNNLLLISDLKGSPIFVYAVAKDINILKPEITALQTALKPSEQYLDYENKRVKLAESFAIKDSGMPRKYIDRGSEQYVIGDTDGFNKKIDELKKEYSEALISRDKQLDDFDKILEEKVSLDFSPIKRKYLPDGITATQLSNIFSLVI